MKNLLFLLTSLFLFIFLSNSALAYTMFSYNPYFNSDATGVLVYNDINNSVSWNSTYNGMNGTVILTNNGSYINTKIFLKQNYVIGEPELFDNFNYTIPEIFLPSNQEGLLILSYMANYTIYGYYPIYATPKLFVVLKPSGWILNETTLNPASGTWQNYTVIVPAVNYDRNLTIEIMYSTYQNITDFVLDKFKFYTYDIIEYRGYWNSLTTERLKYCGNGSTSKSVSTIPLTFWENTGVNDTAYILANGEDGYECHAFKLGDLTLSRRVTAMDGENSGGSCPNYLIYSYRDFYLLNYMGVFCTSDPTMRILLHKITLNSATITTFLGNSSIEADMPLNGVPVTVYTLVNSTDGCFQNLNYNVFADINFLSCRNYSLPSGTKWKILISGYIGGPLFSFFNSNSLINTACTPHWECDVSTGNESYILPNCTKASSNYCGDCGCSSTRCNMPSWTGTQCLGGDVNKHLYVTASGCSYSLGSCGMWICQNITSQTITCFNDMINMTLYEINETGGNETYSNPLANPLLNPATSIALFIGGIFKIQDINISQNITSVLVSMIIGIAVMLFTGFKKPLSVFGILFLASLTIFTLALWFPVWIFIVILVFDGLLIAGVIEDLVG